MKKIIAVFALIGPVFFAEANCEVCTDQSGSSTAYDAVYNLTGDLDVDYGQWLKYYYTPSEEQQEPPSDPPGTYRDPAG